MRKGWWIAALVLSAGLTVPALAQQPAGPAEAGRFFTGVNPRNIKMSKIDPSRALRNSNAARALQPASTQRALSNPFSLGSFFPRVTLGSWPPRLPTFTAVQTPTPPTNFTSSVNLFNNAPK